MAKNTCETSRDLSIRMLKRYGYLNAGFHAGTLTWTQGFSGQTSTVGIAVYLYRDDPTICLRYFYINSDGIKIYVEQTVGVTSTPCFFGGKRYWLVCPLIRNGLPCRQRVGVLYGEGKYFGCRRCYDLVYKSQQETRTGWRGYFGKLLFSGLPEQAEALRIKYWRGMPTKRYSRLLRKISRLPDADPSVIAEGMRARYSRRSIKTLP